MIGGSLLVALALLTRRSSPRRRWARGPVAAAAAGVAVYQVAFFAAVADTGVAVGTIVALGSAPTLAGALEWIVDGRRPEARWAAATALACAGVALLALAGDGAAGVSAPGVALAVVAGGAYATYTLSAKRLLAAGHEPEPVMAAAFGLGGHPAAAGPARLRPGVARASGRDRARAVPRRRADRARLRAVRARAARSCACRRRRR